MGLFKEMDRDGDGVLTLSELRAALESKGIFMPEAQSRDLLARVDIDADGVIDYEEVSPCGSACEET
jgi:Ca2+-binding EF-hand superfamily protein